MFDVRKTETFEAWLTNLRDRKARVLIAERINRLAFYEHFGDAKPVAPGIVELRVHYGPGRMTIKISPFDAADYLTTAEACAEFLSESLKSDDVAYIANALGVVARARGMAEIARKTGLSREGLYKTLSGKGNPELATVLKVLEAVGLELVAQPAAKAKRKSKARSATARHKAA
jgi:probable addiction module antidote protein